MANNGNLIPLDTKNSQLQAERGRKGGLAGKGSPKKSLAAKLVQMRKKGELNDEEQQRYLEILTHPSLNALDILQYLDLIKDNCKNANQQILVADKLIQLMKAHHGEKIKSESQNLNVNLNIDMLKFEELAKKYSKESK